MIEIIKKNIFIAIAFSAIIYLFLFLYANFKDILIAVEQFDWIYIFIIFFLSYLTFYTRYQKWNYYLKLLDIKIENNVSYQIYMTSLLMSFTPGKVGELIKSYMLKSSYDYPISQTAPIVLAERITEFLALLLIALVGIYYFEKGILIIILLTILVFGSVLLLSNNRSTNWILSKLSETKFIKKRVSNLTTALTNSRLLLQPSPLLKMILLSLLSCVFEGIGLYLILIKFNLLISLEWSFFIYAFSIIVGSVSMIPAGIGVTEGTLTYMLIESGATKNIAVLSTFIFRLATLWFGVVIGIISILRYQKKMGKIKFSKLTENKM